jgi:hypothetical protein
MLKILTRTGMLFLFCLPVFACSVSWAGKGLLQTEAPKAMEEPRAAFHLQSVPGTVPDPSKYITVDEIRPGMEAYCLTVYRGTRVEKFDLEVLDVIHNFAPGRDAILVQGTDERFIRTGPVWGCSGSPVYIEGRLAGALAFAFFFSKDPLYGVTPIQEMLTVGKEITPEPRLTFDFSRPIDFARIDKQLTDSRYWKLNSPPGAQHQASGLERLPCLLVTSGLPAEVVEQLDATVRPLGLATVAGVGGTNAEKSSDVQLVPGACLAVPLITGDMSVEVVGTVTEVVGDKVYGFGHGFLGYGPIDLPMATAKVHTVVSNVYRSFKFASALEVIGALRIDEATAIYGQIGAEARMIPMTITVDRYNDAQTRVYNCRLADNRLFTPLVLRLALAGAVLKLGTLPPDHMIEYKVTVGLENAHTLSFENVSTRQGLDEMLAESIGSVAILMNNPYKTVNIRSIEAEVRIVPKNIISHIWSVELSDSKVEAGEEIKIEVVVESYLAEKKKYQSRLKIPQELEPGKYDLIVCGGYDYLRFLRKAVPSRFTPQNLPSLIEAINNILSVRRDHLHFLLVLPDSGVTIERALLPDLPATKALILQSPTRTLQARPYQHWLEKSSHTGTVIIDKKVIHITVEKP